MARCNFCPSVDTDSFVLDNGESLNLCLTHKTEVKNKLSGAPQIKNESPRVSKMSKSDD